MNLFLRIANLVLFTVNLGLFALWFSLVKIDALPKGGDAASYSLNQVSVQVTILGIMVGLGAVILAGLGFFGFQALLERAETRAETAAQKLIAEKWDELMQTGTALFVRQNQGKLPEVGNAKEVQD